MMKSSLEVHGKENIEAIVNKCTTCRIAMLSEGKPYILPMVYGYDWSSETLYLYLHCGLKGRKNEALKDGTCVCFEMDIEGELMGEGRPAHGHSRAFECVIGEGTIEFAKDEEEKKRGFEYIMRHQTGKENWEFVSAYLAIAEVFRIRVDSLRASRKTPLQPGQTVAGKSELFADSGSTLDISHGV